MKIPTREQSFISHPKSKFWNKELNGNIQPKDVYKKSSKKYWFKCDNCNHDFTGILNDIVNKQQWCCYCSNTKLCENKNCKKCFEKSFSSHPKSIFWNNKNTLNPRNIFKGTRIKYWFDCNKCDQQLFHIYLYN